MSLSVHHSRRWQFVACLVGIAATTTTAPVVAAGAAAADIDTLVEHLFRPPFLSQAALSPDGTHLATVTAGEDNRRKIAIVDLGDFTSLVAHGEGNREVSAFRWLDNNRVLVIAAWERIYAGGMYVVDRTRLREPYTVHELDATHVVGIPRTRPDRAFVWVLDTALRTDDVKGLVELDLARGMAPPGPNTVERRRIVREISPPRGGTVVGYGADPDGNLALCYLYRDKKLVAHRYRMADATWDAASLPVADPHRICKVDPDGSSVWLAEWAAAGRYELYRLDPGTGAKAPPVLTDDRYDLGDARLVFSPVTRQLAGVVYEQKRTKSVWFDEAFQRAQAIVDVNFPATDNVLSHIDDALGKFLFFCTAPDQPGLLVLCDAATGKLTKLGEQRPWLAGTPLSASRSVSFKASDGLQLEGYLTLPPATAAGAKPPLLVLAHGGPWVRDAWEFDPEAQLFAHLGYAVLQINYRGSSGYTPAISTEADWDFARMVQDVTEGTQTLLRTGVVDPQRVAIMGGSFGGFISVAAVTREPGLFRCAVTNAGVFDWETFIRSKKEDGRPGEYEEFTDQLGQPGKNSTSFEAISPVRSVEKIRVPVFVAHGREDSIVPIAQSKKLADALEKAHVPHETFFRAWEGHGFSSLKNRIAYYKAVAAFLNANTAAKP